MDGRVGAQDSTLVERLWKSLKYERVYLYTYDSVVEARKSIKQYMDWYNKSRLHSSMGRKTPEEVYIGLMPMIEMAVWKNSRESILKTKDTVQRKGTTFKENPDYH